MGTQAEQVKAGPGWSAWQPSRPYTVGIEEEELATDAHERVSDAIAQLRHLRTWLTEELAELGLAVAGAGTHPTAL